MKSRCRGTSVLLALIVTVTGPLVCHAAGGPLGIDHRLSYDNSGIWKRSYQLGLMDVLIGGELAGGLWEGGKSRLGRTFWQSIDASAASAIATTSLKYAFTRTRPSQTNDPGLWFQGGSHYSFPSGEVAAVSAIVTPFVLEYRHQDPWVYSLEVLPVYDAVARMKVRGHWQSDVLAGFVIGTALGDYAHGRGHPFVLSLLPNGIQVGLRERW